MKNVASFFSKEALDALEEEMGIRLTDDYDYSHDELFNIYEKIEADFPYKYDEDGMPLRLGRIFEHLIDTFYDKGLIK